MLVNNQEVTLRGSDMNATGLVRLRLMEHDYERTVTNHDELQIIELENMKFKYQILKIWNVDKFYINLEGVIVGIL